MSEVHCKKCGNTAPGLDQAPFKNQLGDLVLGNVCKSCWQEWIRTQLMIMNEHRLNPLNDEHGKYLDEQMKIFLNLA